MNQSQWKTVKNYKTNLPSTKYYDLNFSKIQLILRVKVGILSFGEKYADVVFSTPTSIDLEIKDYSTFTLSLINSKIEDYSKWYDILKQYHWFNVIDFPNSSNNQALEIVSKDLQQLNKLFAFT